MTVDPAPGRIRVWVGVANARSHLAQWAVALATFVAVLLLLSGAIFAIAYARGGSSTISDNWVGFLGAVSVLGGLLLSLLTFVLAITAKIRHEHWGWLWLPLLLFPALLAFVVLGEMLWWE